MSTALAALQGRFVDALLGDADLADRVAPPDALAFYRTNVQVNLRAALASAYPVVERLVGAPFFAELSRSYARRFPSARGDLHGFGAGLATFLEGYAPAATLPYLPDVARLEWAVHESASSQDAEPFDAAALARVPAEAQGALCVRLAPAVRRIDSRHPIVAIWEANQPDRDGAPAREGPERALVWRPGPDVKVERIDTCAAGFLDALARGRALEDAIDALGGEAGRLSALLSRWTAEGVIAAFEHPASAR
jgi:hypothetical protein